MQHPYLALKAEYLDLLGRLTVTRETEAREAAERIIKLMPHYKAIAAKTGVPAVWLAAINERESGSSLDCYLGNGQRLSRVTTIVPKGHGPFLGANAFDDGCADALRYEHLIGLDWSDGWAAALYREEAWNGFGPRNHGKHTGYLFSGTSVYTGGKYVADGVWNPNFKDPQIGTIPVMLALIDLDPSLALPGWPANKPWPSIPAPALVPAGHNGGAHGTEWLQASLNTLISAELKTDGSFGRRTSAAVRSFQGAHGLTVDGLAGPVTIAAIEAALAPPTPPANAAPAPASAPAQAPAPEQAAPLALVDAPAAEPPAAILKTAAALATGIYAYPQYPAVAFDKVIICKNGLYAGVKRDGGVCYFAIRGSVTGLDWALNLAAWTVNTKGLGPLHWGFNADADEALGKFLTEAGSDPYVITCHSRGAGEGKIIAAKGVLAGRPPAALVCFGAPRAGYEQLARVLKAVPCRSYRNVMPSDDPITKLPGDLFGVVPFVDEIPFTDVSVAPSLDDEFPVIFGENFKPHYMPLYWRAVDPGAVTIRPLQAAA